MAKTKMTYYFGKTRTDGKGEQRELLGGKGANLADMTGIGLPVPPGFTITTECCAAYYEAGRKLPAGLMEQVAAEIKTLEKELGKKFGDDKDPLLVSVRSGAAASMPGMMNTILNLGLNDKSVVGLAEATGNERFAYDSYRRVINMFGDVVMGVDHEHFEEAFGKIKAKYKATLDTDVPTEGLKELCQAYEKVFKASPGIPPRARTSSMASSSSTPRAKTWWRAFAPRSRWRRCRSGTPRSTSSCWKSRRPWKTTTAICRTSSSPSSEVCCSCCRRGAANAPAPRRSRSPATW
jgi:hypothetical protein